MSVKKKTDLKYINFNLDELFPRQCDYYDAHDQCWRNEKIQKWINNQIKGYTKNGKDPKNFTITNSVRTKNYHK